MPARRLICMLAKICNGCGVAKALGAYRKSPGRYDSRETICKICERPKRNGRGWSRSHRKDLRRAAEARRRRDPKFIVDKRMTCAIGKALRGKKGGRNWESLAGYSVDQLMTHLEAQFLSGMSWANIGEWHIGFRRSPSYMRIQSRTRSVAAGRSKICSHSGRPTT
jgi:hypothetical protein